MNNNLDRKTAFKDTLPTVASGILGFGIIAVQQASFFSWSNVIIYLLLVVHSLLL